MADERLEKDAPTTRSPTRRRIRGADYVGEGERGLWLLFLPFILINTAHWMVHRPRPVRGRPDRPRDSVPASAIDGLSLTLREGGCAVTVDLVGCSALRMPHVVPASARCVSL